MLNCRQQIEDNKEVAEVLLVLGLVLIIILTLISVVLIIITFCRRVYKRRADREKLLIRYSDEESMNTDINDV